MTGRFALLAGTAAMLLAGLGVGGWFVLRRDNDPLTRAERLATQGDLRGAQVELRNAIRSNPSDADGHLRMARLQMKLADPVAAEKEFRLAASLGADRWDVVGQLGEAMIVQARYQDVLAQVPPRAPTTEATSRQLLLRAVAQLALQDLPSAEATLADAERSAPGTAETSLVAARVAAARNDGPTAEAKVDEALRRDPKEVEALLMKARLASAQGNRAAALALAEKAVAAAPWSAMAHMDRANQLIFAGQDAKAQQDIDAVLEVQPRFIDAIYLNAIIMARRARYADAAVELAKLDGIGSRFPQALYYQSLVAVNLGQLETAADFAKRYTQLVPQDPDGVRLAARVELAAGRPANAVAGLQRAVAAGIADAETLGALGRAYGAAGNRTAALDALTKAAALAPLDATIRADLGQAQMQAGRPADALATLQQARELDPRLEQAADAFVSAALAANELDQAEAALARLRAQAGETERVGILTAQLRFARQDYEGARAALTSTLKTYPNSAAARFALARAAIRLGRRIEGMGILRDLLAKEPANLPVLNAYLVLLAEDNQLPPAIQALEAARKASPANPVFAAMLADAQTTIGNPDKALAVLDGMRTDDALPAALLAPLARAQAAAGRRDEAKATYRAALQAAPGDLVLRGLLIDLYRRDNDLDAVRALLRPALAQSPGNSQIMVNMIANEIAANGIDAGIALAASLRQAPANLPAAAFLKGDLLMQVRRPAEAAQAYLAEQRLAPSASMLMRAAGALSAAGQDEAAAQQLQAWLKDNPGTIEAVQALAQLDIRARRYDDAQLALARVLEDRPNDPLALNNLAWVYMTVGDKRARATAQRAYLQSPTPAAGDTLGWIMVREGAAKAALPLLQRASEQRPDDNAIRFHLAVALNDDGQPSEAAKLLRQALASPTAFDDRPAAQRLLTEMDR